LIKGVAHSQFGGGLKSKIGVAETIPKSLGGGSATPIWLGSWFGHPRLAGLGCLDRPWGWLSHLSFVFLQPSFLNIFNFSLIFKFYKFYFILIEYMTCDKFIIRIFRQNNSFRHYLIV
jgi:hypothetical protein